MSFRKAIRFVILFVIISAGALIFGQQAPAAASDRGEAETAGTQLLVSDLSGVTVSIDTPDYLLSEQDIDGTAYKTVSVPGLPDNDVPGAPQLPRVSYLVAVPPHADISISVLEAEGVALDGTFNLPPNPSPAPLVEELTPGEMVYEADQAIFDSASPYPASVAQLGSEAWVRNQRIYRVEAYPFQFDPASGSLTWYPHMQVRLDFSGDRSLYDCTNCSFESELEETLGRTILNYDQAPDWRVPFGSEILKEQIQSPDTFTGLGPRYAIVVDEDGIYRVTQAELQAAGMNVGSVNPQTFRLVNHGQNVSIFVSGEGDGSFDPGDYVTFYGEKFHGDIMEARYAATMTKPNNNPGDPAFAPNNWFWECEDGCDLASYFERYTDDNVYYLIEGGTPGPRMGSVNGTPGGAAVPANYVATVKAEQSNYWWSFELHDDDTWFWDQIQDLDTEHFYTTTLTAVSAGAFSATIHTEITARNHSIAGAPDHHSQQRINGVLFDDTYWNGLNRLKVTANIPQTDLVEGVNTLGITLLSDILPFPPRMYLDFFTVSYVRDFVAIDDQLDFSRSQSGTWKYQVGGFTSGSVEVYNILNPFSPVRVTNPTVNAGTASFQVTDGSQSRYFVTGTTSGIKSAKDLYFYNPPNFDTMTPVENVIITHADFLPAVQTLANHRIANGISTAVIDIDDLFHEFNDGIYHPIAIKNFLAYTFNQWPNPPQYVSLIGNGNFNFKGDGDPSQLYAMPPIPPVYMPPNLAYLDPWQGETDSLNLLATVVGDDVIPDVYIGRIPVDDLAGANNIVNKITSYENAPFETWQQNVMFIADDIPDTAGNFENLAEGIITEFIDPDPFYHPLRLYQDDGDGIPNGFDFGCRGILGSANCKAMTKAITETINMTGTLMINYIGHASVHYWSAQQILTTEHLPSLTNNDMLPVVLSMTCLDGFWIYPNRPSLAHSFINHTNGGAVATFSPTGLGVATGHDLLQHGFFASIFNDGDWNLGAATLEGKMDLFASGANFDLEHTFELFGDPAMGTKSPYKINMTPASSSQSTNVGATANYNLQVQNTGSHIDTFDITIAQNSWTTNASTMTVGPLNPGQSTALSISVNVPAGAINNAQDVAVITATSRGDTSRKDVTTLTTTAISHWIYVTPPSQTLFGTPGQVVEFTLNAKNTSQSSGSYNITFTGNSWTTSLSASTIGPLASGASTTFKVFVTIPGGASGGSSDTVMVKVTSQSNASKSETVTLTTFVSGGGGGIYLPIIMRD